MEPVSYQPGDILRETLYEISEILGDATDALTVERIVIGLFFTGVKLSNGTGGLCFTPVKAIPEAVCCPSSAQAMPASGKLKGKKALRLVDDMFGDNPLKKGMGIAVMNALSMTCWREERPRNYEIRTGVDVLDEAAIPRNGYVAVVGALVPVIRALKRRGTSFGIIELDPGTLRPDEMKFYVPPEGTAEKVSQADLLIITGTTLINDTLEGLLKIRKAGARVIVVGPTASMLPAAFFRRGVGVVGGVIVNDADRVLDVISEAGSGYHFFGKGADRVAIESGVKGRGQARRPQRPRTA
jgi:uncharacterized protein (DUF4213/DUF364 family)